MSVWTKVVGTGSCLPPFKVDNDYLCRYYPGKGPEWILSKTGIKERRFGFDFEANKMREGQFDEDLAEHAALDALEKAEVDPKELGLIVRVTCTPEYLFFPDSACVLHGRLGATKDCAAITIPAGCGGLVNALKNVDGQIKGDSIDTALVVASNTPSSFMDVRDEGAVSMNWLNAAIFGDGACAIVLRRSDTNNSGILASTWGAWHEHDPMLYSAGGSRNPTRPNNVSQHRYQMDAKAVFAYAGVHLDYAMEKLRSKYEITLEEIDWFLYHQANLRILEKISQKKGIPWKKFLINVDKYGNTSSASIGILLDEAVREGKIEKGNLLLLGGVGAGWQYGAILIKW